MSTSIKEEIARIKLETQQIISLRESLAGNTAYERGGIFDTTFESERLTDAAEDLDNWLGLAARNALELSECLARAHTAGREYQQVTANVVLSLIEQAREIEQRIAGLISVRGN